MSSKGQIVIPEAVRTRMKLKAGAQFVVVGENDVSLIDFGKRPSLTPCCQVVLETG
jgi:AbrB family looped-hinge helix DNA binding protein